MLGDWYMPPGGDACSCARAAGRPPQEADSILPTRFYPGCKAEVAASERCAQRKDNTLQVTGTVHVGDPAATNCAGCSLLRCTIHLYITSRLATEYRKYVCIYIYTYLIIYVFCVYIVVP